MNTKSLLVIKEWFLFVSQNYVCNRELVFDFIKVEIRLLAMVIAECMK